MASDQDTWRKLALRLVTEADGTVCPWCCGKIRRISINQFKFEHEASCLADEVFRRSEEEVGYGL